MATEITTIEYMVSADVYARYGADFDTEAVNDAVLAELNAIIPEGVVVHRNGKVYAEKDVEDVARELDWEQLLGHIDLDQILATHGRCGASASALPLRPRAHPEAEHADERHERDDRPHALQQEESPLRFDHRIHGEDSARGTAATSDRVRPIARVRSPPAPEASRRPG
jgi:hypothetical protein